MIAPAAPPPRSLCWTTLTLLVPVGVIAIKDGLMAIPGRFKGQVQIVDLYKQHAATDLFPIIKAHESRIQCLALSNSLAYIATASEKVCLFVLAPLPPPALHLSDRACLLGHAYSHLAFEGCHSSDRIQAWHRICGNLVHVL